MATRKLLSLLSSALLILGSFVVSYQSTIDAVAAEQRKPRVTNRKIREAREWIHMWPGDSINWGDAIDDSRWRTILDAKESVAEAMLQATSAVALTKKQALELAGDCSRVTTSVKPFLIRAVGSRVGTAGFEIYTKKNGDITVIGGALSHHDIPPERRPIVVWLDQPPREVYLWFDVAE